MTSSSETDALINVIDAATDAEKVLRDICHSGKQEDAFFVFDVSELVRKHRQWQEKLPRVEPYYAVKCNPSKLVLEVLAALGTGFDCASQSEMDQILALGVDPERIVFANPTKAASHIRHAASVGVDLVTVDNEAELHKMKKLHPHAKLMLRINAQDIEGPNNMGVKSGCEPDHEAPRLMKLANILGLNIHGICFHIGSGEAMVYRKAIISARSLFDLGKQIGYDMQILDLGGGYPGTKDKPIDEIARVINLALFEYFPKNSVKVIAEPGQFYVTSAFTLATRIHSKREIYSTDRQDLLHVMYYINDGRYTSFRFSASRGVQIVPTTLSKPIGKLIPSSIWGQTCDCLDKVNDHILVSALEIGDWLIYENRGAYTMSMSCGFNGFAAPKVYAVCDIGTKELLEEILPQSKSRFVTETTSKQQVKIELKTHAVSSVI